MDSKSVVMAFFKAVGEEGISALDRFATADFVWWNPSSGDMTVADVHGMIDRMAGFLKSPVTMKLIDIISEDEKVAVEAEGYAELNNGKIYNNKYHFKFLLQGNKISIIKEYHNTYHAFQTFINE